MNWTTVEVFAVVYIAVGMWPACSALRWADLAGPTRTALALGTLLLWPILLAWNAVIWFFRELERDMRP